RDILSLYPKKDRHKIEQIISRLNNQYHFQYYINTHSIDEIRENYYYLSMLDEALQQSGAILSESIKAADIGPSSWFYVHALSAALCWFGSPMQRNLTLTGFEVDAYRLYSDFHTRKDHALGNMQGLQNVEYLDRSFEQQTNTYDVITMFFPFVFEKDHLEWGLPHRLFEPIALLKAAWNSLRSGGLLVIVNQGQEEHTAQLSLLEELDIPITAAFRVEPLLYTYPLDRFIITAIHEH
ncbi:MAG: hypothetical protein WCG34_11160, partial [Leptolinea sp.]